MNKLNRLTRKMGKKYPWVSLLEKDDIVFLSGTADTYDDKVNAGFLAAQTGLYEHVVSDIVVKGLETPKTRAPKAHSHELDGKKVDVLVIGGGVTGSAILRELSRYEVSSLLVDKEEDVAMHASSRNDGNVHVGIDLHSGSLKLEYLHRSVKGFESLCHDLDVGFERTGQGIAVTNRAIMPLVSLYLRHKAKKNGVPDVEICNKKKIHEYEPNLGGNVVGGAIFHSAGQVCPYGLTIALAENAVHNGAEISLGTIVESMESKDGRIVSVTTNRGTIYPRVVVNAAGAFSERISEMAGDRFYSIHPRKGTDIILDKKTFGILSRSSLSVLHLGSALGKSHSKGGGVVPTIDHNMLVGPDAIEQPYLEDFTTSMDSVNKVMGKQTEVFPSLRYGDAITYFSGIRAATYEEDFVIQKGKWVSNIVHAAGIQSPGLTCAPAIGEEVAKLALVELGVKPVQKASFDPHRKGIVRPKELSLEDRDRLIKSNPDYGVIVCRCEEVSKGEIIDAINNPLGVSTVDAIKRRVRAGMGRCQGGFCQEHVVEIISTVKGIPPESVMKKGDGGNILVSPIKEGI